MKVSLQQIKLAGLTVAIAAFSYQIPSQAIQQRVLSSAPNEVATLTASKPAATPGAKAASQWGSFVGGDGHDVSGAAKIVEENGQRYLELDSAFRTDSGPDLFVLLHEQATPTSYSPDSYVNLGRVQALDGAQRYAIPADVDLDAIKSAVIWCQQFDVTFGFATFS